MVPKGYVNMKTMMVKKKTLAAMIVIRSRFFSHTPALAALLYKELAIMSERPVPLPECINTKATVAAPERAQIISRSPFKKPTITSPLNTREKSRE